MFFRDTHQEHKVFIARYLAEELAPADKIRFMKKVARCRHCQKELREFEEIRTEMRENNEETISSRTFAPAVETLRQLHLRDGFRERLLPDKKAAGGNFSLAPAFRLAGYGLMILVIISVPLLLHYTGGSAETPLPEVVKTTSLPPEPAMANTPPEAAVVPSKPAIRPPAPGPIPAATEEQGVILDSASLVLLTNYLSGNINQNNFEYVDLNHNGMIDAVDLAVILNFSVDNVTQSQLQKLLKVKPPAPSPKTIT
jgi:hypothetical protein